MDDGINQGRFDYTYDVDTIDGTGNPVYKELRTKRDMPSDFVNTVRLGVNR